MYFPFACLAVHVLVVFDVLRECWHVQSVVTTVLVEMSVEVGFVGVVVISAVANPLYRLSVHGVVDFE